MFYVGYSFLQILAPLLCERSALSLYPGMLLGVCMLQGYALTA